MFKKSEYLFEIRKVNTKHGIYIFETPNIHSQKILQDKIPINTFVAVKYPLNIQNNNNHSFIEILRPIKGWVFSNDLETLDTLTYIRSGRQYEKYLNNQLKIEGKDEFINQKKLKLEGKVRIYTLKSRENENQDDLVNLKKINHSFKDLKIDLSNELDFNIENLTYDIYQNNFKDKNIPIIIYCGASWCQPCLSFKPKIINMIKKIGKIKLYLLDVDEESNLVDELKIEKIPVLLFLKNGKIVNKMVGIVDDLEKLENILINFKQDFVDQDNIELSEKSIDNKSPKPKKKKKYKTSIKKNI